MESRAAVVKTVPILSNFSMLSFFPNQLAKSFISLLFSSH